MTSVISVLSEIKNIVPVLQKLLPAKTFHYVENAETDEGLRKSEIILADFGLIAPFIYDLPNVKWIQGTSAGVDRLMKSIRKSDPPKCTVSRFSGKHFGYLMSEYVVSNIVNYERKAFELREYQKLKQWNKNADLSPHRSLFELTIGILGIGVIGNKVAETLNSMGATILGYGRRRTFDKEHNKHISMYFTKDELPQLLKNSDYIVNILPSTEESIGLLNGDILEYCKDTETVFVNVGRGSIISEKSLVAALENKWISGAILDVFEQEPLASSSPLWDMPNVIVTPHVSAVSRGKDIAEQLKENLNYFEKNLPIPTTVDFSRGY